MLFRFSDLVALPQRGSCSISPYNLCIVVVKEALTQTSHYSGECFCCVITWKPKLGRTGRLTGQTDFCQGSHVYVFSRACVKPECPHPHKMGTKQLRADSVGSPASCSAGYPGAAGQNAFCSLGV